MCYFINFLQKLKRIVLFRASLASYYPSLAPISMGPHADEHSKRSRYATGGNLSINSQLLPLSIDVKKVFILKNIFQ